MKQFLPLALPLLLLATPALAAPFHGIAVAKDGDSLMVGSTEVRLFGVDAPEYDQRCKRAGTNWSCGAGVIPVSEDGPSTSLGTNGLG